MKKRWNPAHLFLHLVWSNKIKFKPEFLHFHNSSYFKENLWYLFIKYGAAFETTALNFPERTNLDLTLDITIVIFHKLHLLPTDIFWSLFLIFCIGVRYEFIVMIEFIILFLSRVCLKEDLKNVSKTGIRTSWAHLSGIIWPKNCICF